MVKAIQDEVKEILRRGIFKVILKESIPEGSKVLTARYVLAIRSKIEGKVKFKARRFFGGHRDMLKHLLVHNAHTLQLLTRSCHDFLAATSCFRVLSTDVKLAYLQITEPLQRRICIKNPAPEFEL